MICTPEQTRAIAEALGYEQVEASGDAVSYMDVKSAFFTRRVYDPENNAKQREEILLWLIRDSEWDVCYSDEWCFMKLTDRGGLTISDKDYTTALLKTACVEVGV